MAILFNYDYRVIYDQLEDTGTVWLMVSLLLVTVNSLAWGCTSMGCAICCPAIIRLSSKRILSNEFNSYIYRLLSIISL